MYVSLVVWPSISVRLLNQAVHISHDYSSGETAAPCSMPCRPCQSDMIYLYVPITLTIDTPDIVPLSQHSVAMWPGALQQLFFPPGTSTTPLLFIFHIHSVQG